MRFHKLDCFLENGLGYLCGLTILPDLCFLPVETAGRVTECCRIILPSIVQDKSEAFLLASPVLASLCAGSSDWEHSLLIVLNLFACRPSGEKKPTDSKAMPDLNGYQIRVWRELCLVCLAPQTSCWPQLGPAPAAILTKGIGEQEWNRVLVFPGTSSGPVPELDPMGPIGFTCLFLGEVSILIHWNKYFFKKK